MKHGSQLPGHQEEMRSWWVGFRVGRIFQEGKGSLLRGPQWPLLHMVCSLRARGPDSAGAGSSPDAGSLLAYLLCASVLVCMRVLVCTRYGGK